MPSDYYYYYYYHHARRVYLSKDGTRAPYVLRLGILRERALKEAITCVLKRIPLVKLHETRPASSSCADLKLDDGMIVQADLSRTI